jgi:hypothetical protein
MSPEARFGAFRGIVIVAASLGCVAGCSAPSSEQEVRSVNAGGGGSAGVVATGGSAGVGGGLILTVGGMDAQNPNIDADGDGYLGADDCDDRDLQSNPGAFDIPGNQVDEDCSGAADDEPRGCDAALPVDGDASAAAKALGLCRVAVPGAVGKAKTWGVMAARYVFPDGSEKSLEMDSPDCGQALPPHALSHGILPAFGPNVAPRDGAVLAALSSGAARAGVQDLNPGGDVPNFSPAAGQMCTRSKAPEGFPAPAVESCGDIDPIDSEFGVDARDINDAIALELVIRAPTNAKSFAFDFNFYTYEYQDYVCSRYNDSFVTLLYSRSPEVPTDHNISFDSQRNAVSVNNGFVEVCEPYTYVGVRNGMEVTRQFPCQYGTTELLGTGFDVSPPDPDFDLDSEPSLHAATGWLRTQANIVPGEELTLRFAIWDTGDESLDSTVLLDGFTWEAAPGQNMTTRPPR